MEKDYVRITVRIPRDLHREMVKIAQVEGRTLNMQMVRLLQAGTAQWLADAAKPGDKKTTD